MPSDALACLLALGFLGCATSPAPPATPVTLVAETQQTAAPSTGVLKLEELGSAHDGKTVTVLVSLRPEIQACTRSVPASCWGSIAMQSATGGRTPHAELAGSRCSFPPSGPSTCTPTIDPALAYEVTGKVSYSTALITIEPTALDPVP